MHVECLPARSIVISTIPVKEADIDFENLTPELKEKAKACKTPEDILELAKAEGYELSDEEIEGISGGWCPGNCDNYTCKDLCHDACTEIF